MTEDEVRRIVREELWKALHNPYCTKCSHHEGEHDGQACSGRTNMMRPVGDSLYESIPCDCKSFSETFGGPILTA